MPDHDEGLEIRRRTIHFAAVLFLAYVLSVACGSGDSGGGAPAPQTPEATAATPASPTSEPAQTPGSTGQQPLPQNGLPPGIRLERAFPGLTFARMTGLYQAPDGRWFVTEQRGRVFVFDDRPDAQAQLFIDMTDRVSTAGAEEGLLGLAFAPDFANSRTLYLYYSAAGGQRRTVLSRFTIGPDGGAAEFRLLEIPQPFPNHKGGQIAFGPDGYLYVGLGDGGSGRDPMGNGQNLGVILGKILRLDVSGTGADPYRVPADNPFTGRAGARAEVWAYGFRNPWRFSFDPQGRLWVGDVGQNAREEIDVVTRGGNYGWGIMEGMDCLDQRPCNREGLILPIFEYATGANCSITGGFVYRGSGIAALRGAYVYADYCSGRIWALRYDGAAVTEQAEMLDAPIMISSLAQDRGGELYALAHAEAGGIFRIVP
jgi:glucose/arabinose dehydrogenase